MKVKIVWIDSYWTDEDCRDNVHIREGLAWEEVSEEEAKLLEANLYKATGQIKSPTYDKRPVLLYAEVESVKSTIMTLRQWLDGETERKAKTAAKRAEQKAKREAKKAERADADKKRKEALELAQLRALQEKYAGRNVAEVQPHGRRRKIAVNDV